MAGKVTLEEVERLVSRLSSSERFKLVARICGQLSADATPTGERADPDRLARVAQVDAWLSSCDAVAESIQGQFDSAENLRRIRKERATRL